MGISTIVKYEADNGDIHPLRIDQSTVSAVGTPPTGSITSDVFAAANKTNRRYGLRPRLVTLSRTVGTAPNQFKKYRRLPILTQAQWASIAKDDTITVSGTAFTVVGKTGEDT